MKTYVLVDTANTFMRARYAIKGDIDTQIGMALHVVFNSIQKAWTDFNADHVVFCLEGRSWRKDVYTPYKRNRKEAREALSPKELEDEKVFWEVFDEFKDFVNEKTNCSVLRHPQLEADDLIAGWIQNHPNDNHVIISTDGDFVQLIAPNVKQYNGVSKTTITHKGYFNEKGLAIVDKKTKQVKPAPDPKWLLFEKCIRGDTSDNVFSAYPGVRKKSTKNKTGLLEAFQEKETQGFAWNNLMLQRWVDHEGKEHKVIDDYKRNVTLCDLSAQPEEIRKIIDEEIAQTETKNVNQVGIKLIKFCAKWDMQKISQQASSYAEPLQARYTQ